MRSSLTRPCRRGWSSFWDKSKATKVSGTDTRLVLYAARKQHHARTENHARAGRPPTIKPLSSDRTGAVCFAGRSHRYALERVLNGSDGACFFDAQYVYRWHLAVQHRLSVELSRTFAWIHVGPYGNRNSCDNVLDHSFTIRSSVGSSLQSCGNDRVFVAKASTPLGCSLLCRSSFRWRSSGRGGRTRDPRHASVFRSGAIPCHYPWNIWEAHRIHSRVCFVGTSHGHRAIRIESSALSSFQPDIGGAAYSFLFCTLLFDLQIQRQSGKNFFVRFVRVDMARHLDLFLSTLSRNVDVRSNIHNAHGI